MEVLKNVNVSANFNLREPKKMNGKTPLYYVIKCDNHTAKLPIGINVYAYQWNRRTQQVNVSSNQTKEDREYNTAANMKIFDVKAKYMQIISYLCSEESELTSEQVFDYMKAEFLQFNNIIMSNSNPKPNKRKATASKLLKQSFERLYGSKSSPLVKKTSYEIYSRQLDAFIDWMKDNKYTIYDSVAYLKQTTITAYKMDLEDKALKANKGTISTIGNQCNIIVRLINELRKWPQCAKYNIELCQNISKASQVKKDDGKRRALTTDEVNAILSLTNLKEKELFYRDCFVMQLQSGVRFSDLEKLFTHQYNEVYEEGVKCLIVNTQKENITAVVIVNDTIKQLIDKYADAMPYKLTEQTYNKYIKRIFKKANLTNVEHFQRDLNGKSVQDDARLCDIITNHWLRHTFITNKADEGWSPDKLCYCTGHTDDTMIRKVYAHLNNGYKVREAIKENKRVQQQQQENNNNAVELINLGRQQKENDIISECKDVLMYLGEPYENISDINNIDKLNILIYVEHHHQLEQMGVSTKIVKEIYNNPNVTLKEKKEALRQVIEQAQTKIAESK